MPPLPTQLNPVSGKLTPARYLARLPWYLVPALASVAWALLDEDWATWAWSIAAFLLALTVWQLWLIPHQVRLLGVESYRRGTTNHQGQTVAPFHHGSLRARPVR